MSYQTVYGVLMNHPSEYTALGDAINAAPYNKPPAAPVLYIKPSNTFVPHEKTERPVKVSFVPSGVHRDTATANLIGFEIRPSLGLVFQKEYQQGSTHFNKEDFEIGLFLDLTRPPEKPTGSFYRPPIQLNAVDQSLFLPVCSVPVNDWDELDDVQVHGSVNVMKQMSYSTKDFLRKPLTLLKDVSEFIAFEKNDVLLLGCPHSTLKVENAGDIAVAMTFDLMTPTLMVKFADADTQASASKEAV